MPIDPTSSVAIGCARYSGGLAGLARWSTASTAPSTGSETVDVVLDEREAGIVGEVRDVVAVAGDEVVDRDDVPVARAEEVAEVRTQEPGAAGDDRSRHQRPTPW